MAESGKQTISHTAVAARGWQAREWAALALMLLLALVPVLASAIGQPYYLTFVSRIMILALAAVGVNLVLGFGGMVSLGHALYLGVGAYAVGMLSEHGVTSGVLHVLVALLVGALIAAAVGAVCLRTSGMAFIMITLAFAQMAYFVVVGLKRYGGEDGLQIAARSSLGPLDLSSNLVFYYVVLACLALVLWVLSRLIHSRFGMVLRGSKSNERRMAAMGFAHFRYRLVAYVVSALICVLAGVLLANLTRFASPSYMAWTLSGELIMMAVLGGMATLAGPVVGAAVLLVLEEVLAGLKLGLPWGLDALINNHWLGLIGLFIVFMTLGLQRGVFGSLRSRDDIA